MIDALLDFLYWTLLMYWMHRAAHSWPILKDLHWEHHKEITDHGATGWDWRNLFMYFESWPSTVDVWLTEIIPTLVFVYFTGAYWLLFAYYIWGAFIQEFVAHNPKFDIYPFSTHGKWHLVHHADATKNYGLFIPWDLLFGTAKKH